MLKRTKILSILLAFAMILPGAMVSAEEVMQQDQNNPLGSPVSIPERKASSWALNELVDSDRYGLYKTEDLYKGDLRQALSQELRDSLLKNFSEKLENSSLKKIEKPSLLAKIENPKTRGGFLREVYNILIDYEKEEKLAKDPIMYLNHVGIAAGNGSQLFLDRNISAEEAILFVKRATDYIYEENNLSSKGLMWKVENKGNTVFMLGSIHYGEPELYPLRDEILNNFHGSEKLFVEVDISNQEELMKVMVEKMETLEVELEKASKYQDGTRLDSVLDKELYSRIEVIMKKYDIGEEEYKNLKIQGLEQKLNEIILDKAFEGMSEEDNADFDKALEESMAEMADDPLMKMLIEGPKLGIDLYFLDKAKTLKKEIGELESLESQLEILFGGEGLFASPLDESSVEDQIERLKASLENFDDKGNIKEIEAPEMDAELDADFEAEMDKLLEEQVALIDGMFDSIKSGDGEKLAKLFTESGSEELFGAQLLGERDKDMAKKIGALLEGEEGKTYFIVVGAAHFVVDGTIIDNLKDMGYTVEMLK